MKMRVTDYIARRLAAAGISKAFLVQGSADNDLIYSIADTPGIDYICPMHEAAAGFMAEGWSKVTGKPGLAIATSGPGGQNLVTPIANFFYDSVPGIFITGQVNSQFMRRNDELRQLGFQEWPVVDCVRAITKRAVLVRDPRDVPEELEQALQLCQHGRPGPVLLDLPIDVQRAEIECDDPLDGRWSNHSYERGWMPDEYLRRLFRDGRVPGRQAAITSFLNDFWAAERPVMIIGGGVRSERAIAAFDRLADAIQIPVFPTWNALDVVASDTPWYGGRIGTYGGAGRNFAVQNCDLLIAIGCRLSGRITGGVPETFARAARRYVVDVDPGLLSPRNQPQPFHVSCLSDAAEFMEQLRMAFYHRCCQMGAMPKAPPDRTQWNGKVQYWKELYTPFVSDQGPGVNPYLFARCLSRALPDNAVIVTDCGGNVVVMNHAFDTKRGQRYFSNNGNSPMGFSFAAAMGAWFADPSRPVVCVIGDGGFNMNIQELAVMRQHGVNVKTFILNNGIYGITQAFQRRHYGERLEASGAPHYVPPNFLKVAEAYGVAACPIEGTPSIVAQQIEDALRYPRPLICSVECPGFASYQPSITGWATPIEDQTPALPRDEFRRQMIIDPLPGWETGDYPGVPAVHKGMVK